MQREEESFVSDEDDLACAHICVFPVCTATGEMKARALRISASPAVDLHSLSLRDPRCGPSEVTDNLTSFEFTVNTCGTTKEVRGEILMRDTCSDPFNSSGNKEIKQSPKHLTIRINQFTFERIVWNYPANSQLGCGSS